MNLSNQIVSLIRTYVPIGVGLLATWVAAELEVIIDAETSASLSAVFVAIASAVYYTVARRLEAHFPQLGWLLGVANAPMYPTTAREATKRDAGQVNLYFLVIVALVVIIILMATGAIAISA